MTKKYGKLSCKGSQNNDCSLDKVWVSCMEWANIREKYPDSWVLIEALKADSVSDERIIRKIALLNYYSTCAEAMLDYRSEHEKYPNKEMYVYHTQNENLQIKERFWMGIRSR